MTTINKMFNEENYGNYDLNNVDFNEDHRVHNWRNYVSDDLIKIWDELTNREKKIIFIICSKQADSEEWD